MRFIVFVLLSFLTNAVGAQTAYHDSITRFINHYVESHEVVKGKDREQLHFYPVDERLSVLATVEKTPNSPWFKMETSGLLRPLYRIFGIARFVLNGDSAVLVILQSQSLMLNEQYKNYLFIPFTDSSSGKETYAGGRYLDFTFDDIKEGKLRIDFNKAYNPYCAYVNDKYNCPIPPKENNLQLTIEAGEKAFGKAH